MEEFSNTYLQKKILILFGNDIGTFYICIRFIIVMNTTLKRGRTYETIRTIVRT